MLGKAEELDLATHDEIPLEGTQHLARLDRSPDHIALAAIDPEFDALLGRVSMWAIVADVNPTHANKTGYHKAEDVAREYAGPHRPGH